MAARTPPPPPAAGVGAKDGAQAPPDGQDTHHRFRAGALGALGGVVTTVGAVLALIWAISPSWKPDPGEKQLAEARVIAIDKGVPSGDFADRIGKGIVDRCMPGNVYYVRQNLQGFKDRSTSLVYVRFVRRGKQLRGEPSRSLTTPHSRTDDQQVNAVWVEWPYRRVAFFVRFEVWRKKTMLAVVDSPRFRVNQVRFNNFVTNCANR
jgi:hypothetical protein